MAKMMANLLAWMRWAVWVWVWGCACAWKSAKCAKSCDSEAKSFEKSTVELRVLFALPGFAAAVLLLLSNCAAVRGGRGRSSNCWRCCCCPLFSPLFLLTGIVCRVFFTAVSYWQPKLCRRRSSRIVIVIVILSVSVGVSVCGFCCFFAPYSPFIVTVHARYSERNVDFIKFSNSNCS